MKTKTMIIATMLLTAVSLSAKQYPDSVRQASAEEPNIAYGWNFEFEGGLGVGSYLFDQLGSSYSAPHTQNKIKFPACGYRILKKHFIKISDTIKNKGIRILFLYLKILCNHRRIFRFAHICFTECLDIIPELPLS